MVPGIRALIVEDNIVNQKVARLLLERLGCRVDAAANGREAVEMLQRMPYDVVFMDCQMPVMDGYEATRAIRGLDAPARMVPIVAMTAHAMQGDREKCLAAGMDDYVTKPVQRDSIETVLTKWARPEKRGVAPAGAAEPDLEANLAAIATEGGDDFVSDVVTSFLDTARVHLDALGTAFEARELHKVKAIAHDLKGSSATLGATGFAELCRELEDHVRGNAVTDIPNAIGALAKALSGLEATLAEYRLPRANGVAQRGA